MLSLLFIAGVQAQDALAPGILPASVLRHDATLVPPALVPGFSSQGWAGLVCGPLRCELRPIRLERVDGIGLLDPAAQGGKLAIGYAKQGRRPPVKGEYTVVLLKGMKLGPGAAVPTWFTLRTPRVPQDAASGSMGVTIAAPGPSTWQLVPRWNPQGSGEHIPFYLESKTPGAPARRQLLGRIEMSALERGVNPKDLLIWAGDLDGDGRIDLITRTGPTSAHAGLRLWLSSHARGGQMVGAAAELAEWEDVDEAEGC